MIILMILPLLFGNFVQKWVIPDGKCNYGRVVVGDVDHDGLTDIIVRRQLEIKVMFYELTLQNQWQLQDSIVNDGDHLVWDLGDFDLDGYSNLVFHKTFGIPNVGIAIYESTDSFSYPTQEVWRDTVGQPAVVPTSVHDVDQDMLPEIIDNNSNGQPHWVWVYESIGCNQYDTVCTFSPMVDTIEHGMSSTYAFGDFDGDSRVEFVGGELDGYYWVFESPSNNTYEQVHQGQLSSYNIKDCFSVPDADGDGKLEFVVKGFVVPTARIHAFIFEATGDNTYSIIKSFDLSGGHNWYYGGYSEAGDVDGDSIPEIALEGCQNIHIIKAAGNDSFYVWETLPGNNSGSSVRIYDVDSNGLSEVIISGDSQTRIYEYQVGIAEVSGHEIQEINLVAFPNPFNNKLRIAYELTDMSSDHTVGLKIYDACGCLVKQFEPPANTQHNLVSWDGKDAFGRMLPSGVYFLKLHAGEYDVTEKLLLIR